MIRRSPYPLSLKFRKLCPRKHKAAHKHRLCFMRHRALSRIFSTFWRKHQGLPPRQQFNKWRQHKYPRPRPYTKQPRTRRYYQWKARHKRRYQVKPLRALRRRKRLRLRKRLFCKFTWQQRKKLLRLNQKLHQTKRLRACLRRPFARRYCKR